MSANMKNFRCLLLSASLLPLCCPVHALQAADQPADAEQVSEDMISNVDVLIGQITAKLESDKPVTQADLDSVFNDSFFSRSDDPIRDIELVQERVKAKLTDRQKQFDASYGAWISSRIYASDLNPEVLSDPDHVTVSLKIPQAVEDTIRINVDRGRVKLNYEQKEAGHAEKYGVSAPPVTVRRQRVMQLPEGANPAKYKVLASAGKVSIVFDRLNKGTDKPEASK